MRKPKRNSATWATNEERKRAAIDRRLHRIRGLMIAIEEHLNDLEAGDASWGHEQELRDLESKLAYYIGQRRHPEIFNVNEQEAIDRMLGQVDPEGEAHFRV